MAENKRYKNKWKCKLCGDIIESRFRHEMATCSCGAISVDGGLDYCKMSWNTKIADHDTFIPVREEIDDTVADDYNEWYERSMEQMGISLLAEQMIQDIDEEA